MVNKTRGPALILIIIIASLSLCSGIIYAVNPQEYDNNLSNDDTTIVKKYGQLYVERSHILNKDGSPAVLRGMSLFWSQWIGKYYNYDCIKWLRDDWNCTVIRAVMGIESGGYLTNPEAELSKVKAVIDACISLGIYVIVDWHDHNAHKHQAQAVNFFREIASLYGNKPNIIYEIYNEPQQESWKEIIKPYADTVAGAIRELDLDNLIIVGTPNWSQDVDSASIDPLKQNNIVYALHFYAATHKQNLRNKALKAMTRGIALFVSEWGTCESTQTGMLDYAEVESWTKFMDQYKLSWCNWSVADKHETSAVLKEGASALGGWTDVDLTESGMLVRKMIKERNDSLSTDVATAELPEDFRLEQNFPNPFNPATQFRYSIKEYGEVTLRIYNNLGEEITTLVNELKYPGSYSIKFSSAGLPSGIYFARLRSGGKTVVKKISLIK